MGVKVFINHEAEIEEWISKYPCFSFLNNASVPNDINHKWIIDDSYWNYSNLITYNYQIMFIGKTGYGKSTTLNKLVGKHVFETSDVSVCTKELDTAMYRINKSPSFLMVSDLPGVGESNYADNHYYEWYKEMLDASQVVVYLLRADQRDFAVDEMIFSNLFGDEESRKKVLIAINYADKIEPISRKIGLSSEQSASLKRRVDDVSKIFNMSKDSILYYSATDEINMDLLINKIASKLKKAL